MSILRSKYRIQFSWVSLGKKHVFVAWSLKWTVKDVISAFLFAYRNANKKLRSRISSLPLSCICLLCLRNLYVGWEVIQISNILDDVSKWIIFVVLRSDRLRLVHCNFSSSIAKQIHLPIQFVVAKQSHLPIQFVFANLGCFSSQVLCNMAFFTIHSFCYRSKFWKVSTEWLY